MNLKQVGNAIQNFEHYVHSCGGRLCGVSVKVKNVRRSGESFFADVTIYDDEDKTYEVIRDARYPIKKFVVDKNGGGYVISL